MTQDNPVSNNGSAVEQETLRALAAAVQPEVHDFPNEWDAFSVIFTVAAGIEGLTLQQVDPVFYVKSGAFAPGVFSRRALEEPAVNYVQARANGRPFEMAVAFFTYDRESKGIETRVFWDNEAVTFLVNPDSWASVAQAANPYREKKA
ncbi:hypothetical protein QP880_08545 [Dermabacter hominis]|mgnify:CR=1 FL=1|uniref:Uncharacterized protein n=1 Tax=Dermabacter hominis 1368 TaxID=1450519 RepID=A0ABR4SMD2_9MICO|nr:hypothetical protein [Dermabacter hominis]KDS92981.1 hypothetical protein DHOM_08345 [Dermabacter hominis 1368]MCT1807679.1 hypothetical protein [Dermabacter hominis]MDK8804134.1 hypothetical protein [Dermabacter hominis]WIK59917.1 hypothetical protein CYJ49_005525 [Dermabacter hominis]